MAIANCDQIATQQLGGTASAGLSGAATQVRAVEEKGALRIRRFTFTIPGAGPGSANGDQIKLPGMKPTDRIYMLRVYNPGLGAGVTLAAGKLDSNNAANNDNNHYFPPAAVNAPNIIDANLNMTEQVGVDASGASTDAGNAPAAGSPGGGYGSGPINPVLTIGGAAPAAGAQIVGFYIYSGDET